MGDLHVMRDDLRPPEPAADAAPDLGRRPFSREDVERLLGHGAASSARSTGR